MSYDFFKAAIEERQQKGIFVLSAEESEARKQDFLSRLPQDEDVWFFGYGSLMWDPGFDHLEAQAVELSGWHRSFCVISHGYRGTIENPGLVLGLDEGGTCTGIAYRVCGKTQLMGAIEYLWVREMVSGIYDASPVWVQCKDDAERRLCCYTFIVNRDHSQYLGHLPREERARMIATASGMRGPNREYLHNTLSRLDALGFEDKDLQSMAALVDLVDTDAVSEQ